MHLTQREALYLFISIPFNHL